MKLAIIPARAGSKRIPAKNVKPFLGQPILAYSIEAALSSGLFDDVVISTDSEMIGELARSYGASFPFRRSEKNSDDFATTADVLLEVLEMYALHFEKATVVCCIYPTAPFVTAEKLKASFNLLTEGRFDSVFPILRYSHPIQRSLRLDGTHLRMIHPEHVNTRSQDLKPAYHDSGQFYWIMAEQLERKKRIITDNTGAYVISDLEAQDIDTEDDWKLAELKYQLMKNK